MENYRCDGRPKEIIAGWFSSIMRVKRSISYQRLGILWIPVAFFVLIVFVDAKSAGEPRFIDVAEKLGIMGKPGAFPSWCDFEMDGHPDLFAGGRL